MFLLPMLHANVFCPPAFFELIYKTTRVDIFDQSKIKLFSISIINEQQLFIFRFFFSAVTLSEVCFILAVMTIVVVLVVVVVIVVVIVVVLVIVVVVIVIVVVMKDIYLSMIWLVCHDDRHMTRYDLARPS